MRSSILKGPVCLLALLAFTLSMASLSHAQTGTPAVRTAGSLQEEASDNRFIVVFRQLVPDELARIRARGGAIARELPRQSAVAVYLTPDQRAELARDPNVAFIEPDPRRYLLSQTVPYGISMVQADLLSDANAANRKVCIIDSGYLLGHEDLPTAPQVSGAADGGSGPWFEDGVGHGTHVAGTIVALNNSVGVLGVLPNGNVSLFIVRVFNDNEQFVYASDLVGAVQDCRNAGAHVVNMSLGGPGFSTVENTVFSNAFTAGVLSVAAAGNDGSTSFSYPASYDSVVSVGALDSSKVVASFSQKNAQVELAAPGVAVNSTVPLEINTVAVDSVTYQGTWIQFAARTNGVTAQLANGEYCAASNPAWSGKVVLCQRGSGDGSQITFLTKVQNVQSSGGVAAVVYNNVPGPFNGTLDPGSSTIPAIGITQADGQFLVANKLGLSATVVSSRTAGSAYALFNGTSMATPHVAGVAALVWSLHPACTNAQIRTALQTTAEDLGTVGRDNDYGFGLVRAQAASDALTPVCGIISGARRRGQTTSE